MVKEKNNLYLLEKLYNVRHLGGFKTINGRELKNHKYIRGSAKGSLSAAEKKFFYDLGVRVIIDLRYSNELTKTISPLKDYEDISYYHVDMMGEFWQIRQDGYSDISELYIDLLDDSQTKIKAVFDIFLKHENEGIYYHCTAGKDRTGVISMLLLDLVGVPEPTIIANYSESYENNKNRPGYLNMPEEWRYLTYSKPEYMERALNHLRKRYQNSEKYLKIIGFSQEEIEKIKRSLLI